MAKDKTKIWTDKNASELKKLMAERAAKLRTFRFSVAGSKITNVKEGKKLRREIAQILTALRTIK